MSTLPQGGRIPQALQAIFLESNRGEEVHKPPSAGISFKVFTKWFDSRRTYDKSSRKTTHHWLHRSVAEPRKSQSVAVIKTEEVKILPKVSITPSKDVPKQSASSGKVCQGLVYGIPLRSRI
jgi:hypothetical protein